jgi:hypothetical protein
MTIYLPSVVPPSLLQAVAGTMPVVAVVAVAAIACTLLGVGALAGACWLGARRPAHPFALWRAVSPQSTPGADP